MTGDDLERDLRAAFDARARSAVGDDAVPPAPRFATAGAAATARAAAAGRRHRRARMLAPLAAAAAVVAVGTSVVALGDHAQHRPSAAGASSQRTAIPAPTSSSSGRSAPPAVPRATPTRGSGAPVHIRLGTEDGQRYGVGMPVIAYFSRRLTDAGSLAAATSISVDGAPARGAWYFEPSSFLRGYPVEGHLRLQSYWPAHAQIAIVIATKGVTAGRGLHFDDSVTASFSTGARTVAVVAGHRITVTRDGTPVASFPVSLGAQATPTTSGTKIVMEKGESLCQRGPGYNECGIKYTQRLTYSGEYLLSAPWNVSNIARGIDSSNGCTNLLPNDARKLYDILELGDVVNFPAAGGPPMSPGEGYGDWNVPWTTWLGGGLVPAHQH